MIKIALLATLSVVAAFVAVAGSFNPLSSGSNAEAQEVVFDIGVQGPPFQWAPNNVTMPVGTTVRWTVTGGAPHTVTSEGCFDARIGECTFDSGAAREDFLRAGTPNESFEFTFDEPGVYPFYCRLHGQPGGGGQFGVIVVVEPGKNPPAGPRFAPQSLLDTIAAEQAAEEPAITPPATGDGGLVADARSASWQIAFGAVSVLAAGGALALMRARVRS